MRIAAKLGMVLQIFYSGVYRTAILLARHAVTYTHRSDVYPWLSRGICFSSWLVATAGRHILWGAAALDASIIIREDLAIW